jgi:hypothetical protein
MVDIVTPQVDTSGSSPEGHDAEMIAKVDALDKSLQEEQQNQEPPKLAGKFASKEELEKAYLELEKKLGSPKKEEAPVDPSQVDQGKAEEIAKDAGLDINQMQQWYSQNGQLSEEHYQALEKSGIPKEIVDQYIAGQEAQAEKYRDSIISKVGGQDNFSAMAEWAKVNMNEAEIAAYNKATSSADMAVVENAVLGLAYRYQSAVGKDPKLLGGQVAGSSGFQSVAQLTEAMKDPRYEKDPAYRKDVQNRLANSNIM